MFGFSRNQPAVFRSGKAAGKPLVEKNFTYTSISSPTNALKPSKSTFITRSLLRNIL
jgi:hypothetical protein